MLYKTRGNKGSLLGRGAEDKEKSRPQAYLSGASWWPTILLLSYWMGIVSRGRRTAEESEFLF